MKRFKEYQNLDLTAVADEILDYWKTANIFEKSIADRQGQKPFVFFEGPPSANGLPGIHHVIGRAVKDIFLRYKTMTGHQVRRKAGWDTHGLPVELGVEKALGITKEDIGQKISVEAYNTACKEAVMRYTDTWNDLTEKMGYWVDMDDPYVTYTPKYMESVWWLLSQLYQKKMLYKGYTIQPFSPKAGTGLSSHEINQPGAYQDVTDTTIIAQFKTIEETLPAPLKKYWGIPLPIWRDESGQHEICIGSVAQLKDEIQKSIAAGLMQKDPFEGFDPADMSDKNYEKIDLHKNIVDRIILVSPAGIPMKREADLIDVWFDSGAMPYAQWHYPFENKHFIDEQKNYPADFIAEGVDQTRGWFYTLHTISSLVFGREAYKNVISNGLVLDKDGKKMSKRLGNTIDPFKTLKTYGADATRWYMIGNANPWDNLRFDLEGVEEVRRKFFGTLYNTYAFFVLYANLDAFDTAAENIPVTQRTELDRWILSELHSLTEKVTAFYEDYEPTKVVRAVQYFVTEDLSNWFVRLSRRRFWKSDDPKDKKMAYQTLYECLVTVSKLAAPIAPFFTDRLYQDLTGDVSVHLADFPKANQSYKNVLLERRMQKAQKIASMALSLRKKEKIRVRQPLNKIIVPIINETDKEDLLAVADLVCKEINVKKIEILEDSKILVKKIQPNFKVLGPRFGKNMKAVAAVVATLSQEHINTLDKKGTILLDVSGEKIPLKKEEAIITFENIEGWVVTSQNELTVALDITIDEALKKEGIIREFINRIQNLRKEMGLLVTDKIEIKIQADEVLEKAMYAYENHFKTETLTEKISFVKDEIPTAVDLNFEKITIKISIKKI
uniref:Isoleucine--tRNA ligase n=1 Tax=Stylophora pistillata TaxID=50429 RepID=A0A2B4S1L6_STYPI